MPDAVVASRADNRRYVMTIEVPTSKSHQLTDAELQEITGGLLPPGFVTPAILISMGGGGGGGTTSGTGTAGTRAGGTGKVGS
jgi:bacteriocin-like protein